MSRAEQSRAEQSRAEQSRAALTLISLCTFALGCGLPEPTEAATAALSAAELPPVSGAAVDPSSEGDADFLLLDRADPAELTAYSERACPLSLPPEARVRCRASLIEALTRRAVEADRRLSASLSSSTDSMTNEMERRFGGARRAIVDAPITEDETAELHDLWIEAEVHAEPTETDLVLDEALRAEDVDRLAEFETRMGRAVP